MRSTSATVTGRSIGSRYGEIDSSRRQETAVARKGTYAAIDVGTTKVCTLVGDVAPDGGVRVMGGGVVASVGLSKGVVENVHEAAEAARASGDKAERTSGQGV